MPNNAEHPPIPPDCGYFRQGDGGTWHFVPCGLGNGSVALDAALHTTFGTVVTEGLPVAYPGPWWGPIIAAVAEVAWLREAERLREEYVSAFTYNTRPLIVGDLEALRKAREDYALDSRIQGARDATAHARAWREWGEANAEGR